MTLIGCKHYKLRDAYVRCSMTDVFWLLINGFRYCDTDTDAVEILFLPISICRICFLCVRGAAEPAKNAKETVGILICCLLLKGQYVNMGQWCCIGFRHMCPATVNPRSLATLLGSDGLCVHEAVKHPEWSSLLFARCWSMAKPAHIGTHRNDANCDANCHANHDANCCSTNFIKLQCCEDLKRFEDIWRVRSSCGPPSDPGQRSERVKPGSLKVMSHGAVKTILYIMCAYIYIVCIYIYYVYIYFLLYVYIYIYILCIRI